MHVYTVRNASRQPEVLDRSWERNRVIFRPRQGAVALLVARVPWVSYDRRVCGRSSSARMKQLSRDLQMGTVKVVGRTYLLDISIEHGSRLPQLSLRVNVSEPGMVRC